MANYLMIDLAKVGDDTGNEKFVSSPEELSDALTPKLEGVPHQTREAREEVGSSS
jgi:hypothetical protein